MAFKVLHSACVQAMNPSTLRNVFDQKENGGQGLLLFVYLYLYFHYYCSSTCLTLAQHKSIYTESREDGNLQRAEIVITQICAQTTYILSVCP